VIIPWLLLLSADIGAIERRYNSAATLRIEFQQTYRSGARTQVESGVLTLRKPGRMRWEYQQPAGKVFVSDGKQLWFYSPAANRVEITRVKEAADLRAPLAFLLGRLDFKRDFQTLTEAGGELIGVPKDGRAPYREVRFRTDGAGGITGLTITGQDAAVMNFAFSGEERNVAVKESLFTFSPPPGAEVVVLRGEGQ
jgi:outer membrane lipoprotein carrier protein